MKKRSGLCAVLGVLVIAAFFANDRRAIEEGIALHNAAEVTPEGNIERGKAILAPLIDKYPIAKGYYGSLITLEAGVWEKNKKAIKATTCLENGTALIDEAVEAGPEISDLRFLRMINSYELSVKSPMNRYKVMKTDIDWLSSRRSTLEAHDQSLLDLYKGLYLIKARKLSEAIASFESCIAVAPGSSEAEEAQKQLNKYGE